MKIFMCCARGIGVVLSLQLVILLLFIPNSFIPHTLGRL